MRFELIALSLAGLVAAISPPTPDSKHFPAPIPTPRSTPKPAKGVNFKRLMSATILHQDMNYIFPGPLGLRINRGYVGFVKIISISRLEIETSAHNEFQR
jgi:hypothetical protein